MFEDYLFVISSSKGKSKADAARLARLKQIVHDAAPARCPRCGRPNYYVGSCGYCGHVYTIKGVFV